MSAPKWPLPLGHVFGPSPLIVTHHTGRSRLESTQLHMWQSRFAGGWGRPWMRPSGVFDGLTQRAVLEVQGVAGLPRTGLLGPREWAAVWDHTPPPPKPRKKPERKRTPRPELAKRKAFWERYSRWEIQPGSVPDAPAWYPGRPFGPHHRGEHVKIVQEVLGFKPTGRFQVGLGKRIAGLQRVHGLPESGVVDVRMAQVIEDMRT